MNKHTFHQMTLGFEVETAHMKDQWYWSLCAALLIVCLQLAVVLYKAGPGTLSERYLNLAQWDTHWYENIIDKGYHANFPVDIWNSNSVNIKFFPGYPISAKFVQWLTGLSTTVSLAIAAQLAAIGFWTYFLLLLRRYKISWPLILSGVTLILSFPSAYFLVMPYTEPLFMMSLFGYIYWLDDKRKHSWWIAGIHGCILSSTKIIGAAVAILPLIYYLCSRKTRYMQKRKMIAISLMNPTGIVAYLTYVHLKFGNWQLPFMAEHAWGAYPNYFGIFHLQFYKIFKPSVVAGVMNPDHVSMIAYPIALISIAILLGLDIIYSMRKKATMLSQRIILYLGALALWYAYAGARYSNLGTAGIRYMLPVVILLIIATLHFCHHCKKERLVQTITEILFPCLSIFFASIQLGYIGAFTHGGWVA